MNDKMRKRIWPVSLIAILGVIAMLAVVWSSDSVPVQAQSPPPVWFVGDGLAATGQSDTQINLSWNVATGATSYKLERKTGSGAYSITGGALTGTTHNDMGLMASTTYTYRITAVNASGETVGSEVMATTMAAGNGGNGNGGTDPVTMLKSSSTSGGASVKLTLTIVNLPNNLNSGSWVEIYLENDYQEPDSISRQDVVFIAMNADGTGDRETNDGGTVTAAAVEIDDGGEIGNPDPDKDDDEDAVVISARIPDMDPRDDNFGYPVQGQTLMMIVASSAGIKNPTEATSNSTGYAIVGAGEDRGDVADMKLTDLLVKAKIALSADDGGRGKEVTITGSGFNNGVDAEAFVLVAAAGLNDDDDMDNDITCGKVIAEGDSLGTANVGTDDKFAIVYTVHQDEFKPGNVNYICAEDSEAGNPRQASAVKTFDLTASISLDPAEADSGDEVTLKARDFGGALTSISLGPDKTWTPTADATDTGYFPIKEITDNKDYTFDVPGGLSGVIQVSAKRDSTRKTANLTITPSSLELSKTEVAPNESIIITGSGFNENVKILVKDIKIDGEPLDVSNAGTQGTGDGRYVQTTSSGAFTATVRVWAMGDDNPTLDDATYTIKVTDEMDFVGKAKITILEPTVSVMPEMVSPRDFITISGENWPISSADDDHEVTIMVDGRNRSANIDGNGRFRYQYQLRSNIGIGDEHEVVVEFKSDGGSIEEEATFEVHDAGIMLTPPEAAPGQTISLEIEGMPPYTLVDHVNIDGVNRLGGQNPNTDRHGNVMITGVLVPYLDPGFYPVEVMVGEETRVVQLEVLAEAVVAGAAAALPGAVEDLGDSLVRVFHFNTSSKVWTFYDPRPEFEGLNTLTELAAGQPYWILVSETQENVVLNGRPRDLTCVGGDCWNQLVW